MSNRIGAGADETAPSLAAFEDMVHEAHAALPAEFRRLTAGVVLRVAEFATAEVLAGLGIADPYGLLGLFQGVGMAHDDAVPFSGRLPNMVFLYRRPILAFAEAEDQTVAAVITHVLVHEIGHHFGFSDDDMDAIDAGLR
jgi:predicted Zn-dependent protease with MMP-like domain